MPKFCSNVSMMFAEVPFLDRFEAAAKAGFKGTEFQFPYAFDKDAIAEKVHGNNLTQVLFNTPAGDFAAGDRGMASDPNRIGEFQDGVGTAIEYAKVLGCKRVNVASGIMPKGVDEAAMFDTLVANLKFAAAEFAKIGVLCLTEPINRFDIPGFFIDTFAKAVPVLDAVGSDNLKIEFDIYHTQRNTGELANTLKNGFDRIGHIQLADNPGRHEPGTGEINYPFMFSLIDDLGYDGWIGCEYAPLNGTLEGLGWMKPYL